MMMVIVMVGYGSVDEGAGGDYCYSTEYERTCRHPEASMCCHAPSYEWALEGDNGTERMCHLYFSLCLVIEIAKFSTEYNSGLFHICHAPSYEWALEGDNGTERMCHLYFSLCLVIEIAKFSTEYNSGLFHICCICVLLACLPLIGQISRCDLSSVCVRDMHTRHHIQIMLWPPQE
eukprot:TRINITY_DN41603_c2_g2_i1.p1 TRINITY_DN41603_c2_g2~~TRINITY_DN41603_c2_g2_i1.p1  ORF type:complete len:176 (+),score=25.14 TRINITY_DN41603_c2_g2_i1:373-900(+)